MTTLSRPHANIALGLREIIVEVRRRYPEEGLGPGAPPTIQRDYLLACQHARYLAEHLVGVDKDAFLRACGLEGVK